MTAMSMPETRVVIFGAGVGGCQLWSRLVGERSLSIVAFVDNDPKKQGSTLFELPVCSAAQLPALEYDLIVVASVHGREIAAQLLAAGVPGDRLLASGNAEAVVRELRSRGVMGAEMDKPQAPALRVAIFGTGIGGIRAWQAIAANDRVEAVAFLDNDERRRQAPLLGLPVLDPSTIDAASIDGVVVGSMHAGSITGQLERAGMPKARILSAAMLDAALKLS
jgi:FlaA1/EpsC-like NDP-sugar epimerase